MEEKEIIRELLSRGEMPTPENVKAFNQNNTPVTTQATTNKSTNVEIVDYHDYTPGKVEVLDFTQYYKGRYNFLKNLIVNRSEASTAVSISKLSGEGEKAIIIAMIRDIQKFPTGTIKVVLEDTSGEIDAILSTKKEELVEKIKYLTPDDVLAFVGSKVKETFFVNDIIWPDIPIRKWKPINEEVYAAFTADFHVGSDMFLPEDLEKFIGFLRGEVGDDKQKELARKIKYVFVVGDVVDGVGVYPDQEKELHITDLYEQYKVLASYLERIPKDKHLIICPGNHDGLRICEPQPPLDKKFAGPLYEIPNITMVGNPATINIHKQENHPGFDVMLYHGFSFPFYSDTIEALRLEGGVDAPDKIIEYLLKRRHLAPTHGSALALPIESNPLLIKKIPDIIATGHLHKAKIGSYKGVLMISASCWQAKTSFMEKIGIHPDPGMVPIINLQNGSGTLMKFKDD